MTFQEWLQRYHPDCVDEPTEELIGEYQVWQRTHTQAKCTYCQTGELPVEETTLKGIL